MDAFGYGLTDFIPCEITGCRAADIHHIENKGMGGDPKKGKDRIENLMAIDRQYHFKYGDRPGYMGFMYQRHKDFMLANGVSFDETWIDEKIKFYNTIEV